MITRLIKIIVCSFLITASLKANVTLDLQGLLANHGQLGKHGIYILDAKTKTPVFMKNENETLNPASALKILISATTLDLLGLAHTFKTEFKESGQNLCLIGGGDPSLVQESLKELASVGAARIDPEAKKKIKTLIVDESMFPAENPFDRSFEGDADRAFTADISSLSVNFNSIAVRVEPTRLGAHAKVMVTPDIPEIKVINQTKTASSGNKKDIALSFKNTANVPYTLTVMGSVSISPNQIKGDDFFSLYASVPSEPAVYAGYIFAGALKNEGIHIQQVQKGACPKTARPLYSWSSKALSSIIQDMNIYSNNFIAEMLLRSLDPTHSKSAGLDAVKAWMQAKKIPISGETVIENASGLSRKNRISARTLAHILLAAGESLETGPEMISSLSISGKTGTMRNRLKQKPGANEPDFIVRAKSGTLSNAVSLVGKAQSEKKDLVFAFIFNDAKIPAYSIQSLENVLLKTALEIR